MAVVSWNLTLGRLWFGIVFLGKVLTCVSLRGPAPFQHAPSGRRLQQTIPLLVLRGNGDEAVEPKAVANFPVYCLANGHSATRVNIC